MSWVRRLRAFLQSAPARLNGSYVELGAEHVTYPRSWHQFPADQQLELRIKAAKDLIGEVYVRPDRKLVQDQPDYGEQRTR